MRNPKQGTAPGYMRVHSDQGPLLRRSNRRSVPESGGELFAQDEAKQLVRVLEEASPKLEWAEASDQ